MKKEYKIQMPRGSLPVSSIGLVLLAAVLCLSVISVNLGPTTVPVWSVIKELFSGNQTSMGLIFWQIRLPRVILAILAGATLGLSGAAIQGLFRNPLAEPGIIGVSASASLGAVVVFYFGLYQIISWALPVGGLIGALVAVVLIYLLAGREQRVLTLILAGVAVNAIAGSLVSLALNLAPNPYAALEIVFWLLGSLADRSFNHIVLVLPLMAVGWFLLVSGSRGLDALSLGEDTARSLGVDVNLLKLRIILGTALSVGSIVSVTGGISFVGLIVPHLLRPLVGYEPSRLLFLSAIGGALLVLAADIVTRILPTTQELQIGVVTAVIGGPFFLYLILATRRQVS